MIRLPLRSVIPRSWFQRKPPGTGMQVQSLEASVVLGHEEWGQAAWRGSGKVLGGKTQCAALPDAVRCKHGCSALHLKSGGSVDGRYIEPVPFSRPFPFLLPSFSIPSLILFRSFSRPFPFLLSPFSVPSLILFHSFSHPFPLVSVLCFHLHRIAWQSPAWRGAGQGFAMLGCPVSAFARCGTAWCLV